MLHGLTSRPIPVFKQREAMPKKAHWQACFSHLVKLHFPTRLSPTLGSLPSSDCRRIFLVSEGGVNLMKAVHLDSRKGIQKRTLNVKRAYFLNGHSSSI